MRIPYYCCNSYHHAVALFLSVILTSLMLSIKFELVQDNYFKKVIMTLRTFSTND